MPEETKSRFGNNGIECITKGAELGAKTFENIITISGAAIGFMMTFWTFAKNNKDFSIGVWGQGFIIFSLIAFLSVIVTSIKRNYYGGHDLVIYGRILLNKSNKITTNGNAGHAKKLEEEYLEFKKKYDFYTKKRVLYSNIATLVFITGILSVILSFLSAVIDIHIGSFKIGN